MGGNHKKALRGRIIYGTEKKGIGCHFSFRILRSPPSWSIYRVGGFGSGEECQIFFTFWALSYLKKGNSQASEYKVDQTENSAHIQIIQEHIEKRHLESFSELIAQSKALGAEFYTCTNSMSILNIARDELIKEVDRPMGSTTFLTETVDDQILFI
jgi:peroxiredoxin family protein